MTLLPASPLGSPFLVRVSYRLRGILLVLGRVLGAVSSLEAIPPLITTNILSDGMTGPCGTDEVFRHPSQVLDGREILPVVTEVLGIDYSLAQDSAPEISICSAHPHSQQIPNPPRYSGFSNNRHRYRPSLFFSTVP